MTVKQIYGNKCMDRQIAEAIQTNNIPNLDRINTKIDYKQHRLPRASLTWEWLRATPQRGVSLNKGWIAEKLTQVSSKTSFQMYKISD